MAKVEELRGKSADELKEMALTLKKELFNMRFQVASGEMHNTARFRVMRRDIARVKTLLNEPAVDATAPKKAPKVKKTKEEKAAKKAVAPAKTAKPAKKIATKKKASGE